MTTGFPAEKKAEEGVSAEDTAREGNGATKFTENCGGSLILVKQTKG